MEITFLKEKGFVKSALTTGLVCVLVFTLMVYGALQYQAALQIDDLKVAEQAKTRMTSGLLEQVFEYTANDLLAIASLPAAVRFNSGRSEEWKEALQTVFRVQLAQKNDYSQLRFLDHDGTELVRLEKTNQRVFNRQDTAMQFKGERYYVIETAALSEGEVYVSPLDLNVENGQVEVPYKPMIRFGTRVVDEGSGKQGLVVLNMKGEALLDTFETGMAGSYPAFLLNDEGHIIAGPDENDEWGFMFGLPSSFARDFPEALERILTDDYGWIETSKGLFVYETVHPLKQSQSSQLAEQYTWKTVSFIPSSALPSSTLLSHSWVVGFYIIGVLLTLVISFYTHFLIHKRRELRRANVQQSKRFWKISSVLGDGLIVMDKYGVLTYMNPEAERILGWDANDLVHKRGHEVFHVHEQDNPDCSVMEVMKTRQLYRSKDEEFRRKDESTIPVILNAAPLTSDTGDEGVVISFQDFSEIKEYQETIHSLAFQDSLTGLPNRRVLEDRMQLAIALSGRHARHLGLMFLDLDHFKQVNDTYGHDAGDILLKEIAERLERNVRETDTVVRMGGDEFIVLLPEVSSTENAKVVAEKILAAVSQPVVLPLGVARVGVSIGITIARGAGLTIEGVMQSADKAMYEAKRRGKNQIYVNEYLLPSNDADRQS
ncbi:putative diguanylate cyclase YegE [Marinobacter litoralis]|uniref:Putative diguanylate cyclase YegE n=1 Tax=Marinobacter litoralis TaxID=187981 RepID=A0A3M2RM15_9GAMM|nr:diguanylate cyclase [Marinobacter litoralis]RMJ06393.1 putative diguanylate cyclase YegE [Marinobacter litoralis]